MSQLAKMSNQHLFITNINRIYFNNIDREREREGQERQREMSISQHK